MKLANQSVVIAQLPQFPGSNQGCFSKDWEVAAQSRLDKPVLQRQGCIPVYMNGCLAVFRERTVKKEVLYGLHFSSIAQDTGVIVLNI